MSTSGIDKMENKYTLYHKDGLMDIFIGLGIIFAGLFIWTELVWMAAIFIPVFLPSFQAARKRFLQTRIGELEHNSQQEEKAQKLILSITMLLGVLFLAGIGMFLAFDFLSGAVNEWLRNYFLLMLGTIFGGVWAFAGWMLKIVRFYMYGAFTFLILGAAQFLPMPFWVALAALGGMIVLVGLMVLIRFRQQYPIIE
jgi:hypothetical protein